MGKMGGMGGGPPGGNGFEGIDFSKLGAGPGGDFGGDLPEESDDEGEEDDDDMPELEGEEEAAKVPAAADAPKTSSKIEEVE